MTTYKTIDEYINLQSNKAREALITLRKCILSAVPNAKELINYNIPAFALTEKGKRDQQIMIAGYKNHVGFYPHPTTIEQFTDRLAEYKFGKGSVQFPLDKPIPTDLVIEMVKYNEKLVLECR